MRPDYAPGSAMEWLGRAKGKIALARLPLPEEGYWEDLCYMAQQSVELGIKAVYRHNAWRFAFVHDLGFLFDGLEQLGLPVPESVREAERLTIYATQMRYPGMSGSTTQEDYRKLLAIAEQALSWCEQQLRA